MVSPYGKSHWRDHAAPIIARVLAETTGKDERTIKKALHDAYPFGQRAYYPYKIWRDEIRYQRKGGKAPRFVDVADSRKLVFGDRSNPFGESA